MCVERWIRKCSYHHLLLRSFHRWFHRRSYTSSIVKSICLSMKPSSSKSSRCLSRSRFFVSRTELYRTSWEALLHSFRTITMSLFRLSFPFSRLCFRIFLDRFLLVKEDMEEVFENWFMRYTVMFGQVVFCDSFVHGWWMKKWGDKKQRRLVRCGTRETEIRDKSRTNPGLRLMLAVVSKASNSEIATGRVGMRPVYTRYV